MQTNNVAYSPPPPPPPPPYTHTDVSISFNAVFSFNDTPAAIQGVNLLPSCTATGFAAQTILRFEWRFNGTSSYVNSVSVIGGRATATFTIAAPTKANAGWYTCVASSGNISVQTSAYLAVACKSNSGYTARARHN